LIGETVLVFALGFAVASVATFAFVSASEVTAGVESHPAIRNAANSPAVVKTRDIL
jgi:hypothetical protein